MNCNYFRRLLLIALAVIFIPTMGIAQQTTPEEKPTTEKPSKIRKVVTEAGKIADEVKVLSQTVVEIYDTFANKQRKRLADSSKQITSADDASKQNSFAENILCPKFSKPTLNSLKVTYDDVNTPSCAAFPLIDIATDTIPLRFAKSEEEYSSVRKFGNANYLFVMLYIINGADSNLAPQITTAKNVKITTSLTSNGNIHKIIATYTGDNISPTTGSITVQTKPNEYLKVIPNSGYMYTYEAIPILDSQALNIGNSTYLLGDLDAGLIFSLFFTFKIQVLKK